MGDQREHFLHRFLLLLQHLDKPSNDNYNTLESSITFSIHTDCHNLSDMNRKQYLKRKLEQMVGLLASKITNYG